MEAEHERKKAEIEGTKEQQVRQREILEKQHAVELIELNTKIENARRAAEKAALEHELTMAGLRADRGAERKVKERESQSDNRHKEVLDELREMQSSGPPARRSPCSTFGSGCRKCQSGGRALVSPEFNVSPSALARLGYHVDRQSLVQFRGTKRWRTESRLRCTRRNWSRATLGRRR